MPAVRAFRRMGMTRVITVIVAFVIAVIVAFVIVVVCFGGERRR
jgi:hypothetical protein